MFPTHQQFSVGNVAQHFMKKFVLSTTFSLRVVLRCDNKKKNVKNICRKYKIKFPRGFTYISTLNPKCGVFLCTNNHILLVNYRFLLCWKFVARGKLLLNKDTTEISTVDVFEYSLQTSYNYIEFNEPILCGQHKVCG